MKVRRTPWWQYVVSIVLGTLCGATLVKVTEHSAYTLMGAPWLVSLLLAMLGTLVLVLSWQVHKYVKGDIKVMSMDRAVNTLLLAKSLGIAGAALAGWYGGQLIMSLGHLEAEFYSDAALECGVATVICLIDMVIGIVGEYWCQLPPKDGPEHPKVKEAERRRNLAPAAGTAGAAGAGGAEKTGRTADGTDHRNGRRKTR
ncbi:hypothetical protein CS006_01475 [Bifidobacterium primatium]|uniref:DUF3180 domain-containing protein n=1 Tax=Bifidobacterium primatium TaxID=2045438 RepID=A0A2M9HAN6_9BIFI|nr:DUF3180 domain-containing protein [Bifidobacterium primatium]PJM73868.1 hypothetical protein CS006_01475 [Bifidobacterium primatium]